MTEIAISQATASIRLRSLLQITRSCSPQFYDAVVHVGQITTDLATDIICRSATSAQLETNVTLWQLLAARLLSVGNKEVSIGRDSTTKPKIQPGAVGSKKSTVNPAPGVVMKKLLW